jgi:ABC-type dipeptide/oligopeptide/nickel transport system ATPase subunit/phage terminase Nu1 subunit (DNA packaging protein)
MNEQQFIKNGLEGFKNAPKGQTGYIHGIDIRNPEHLICESPIEQLRYELMGGVNMKQLDRLRVTLKVTRFPQLSPVHAYRNTVDLYSDTQVKRYIREAAEKLELGTTDLTNTIYSLIDGVEKYRMERRKEQLLPQRAPRIELSAKAKTEAKKLLKNPKLLDQVSDLLNQAGLINEEDNGLLLFLIFLTRKFDSPLHALIHGSSGSGKTNLLKTVINCVPDEQRHITTALTENVLFYPPYKEFWAHKVLMLEDLDGSMNALYTLREFMSNGHIVKYTTEMDSQSGEHKQKKLEAKGPVCIVGATTKDKLYEDNSNRSYLIHVDESYKHQQDVMMYQNEIAAGMIDKTKIEEVQQLLKNAQRLLETVEIRNPFQPELMLPPVVFKPLRTNQHYIALIKAITFLHQFQLDIQQDERGRYIETKLDHIEWANKLCRESLLRKSDQLTGAQRMFFERLKNYLKDQKITEKNNKTFYGSEVRKALKMHPQQTQRMFKALVNNGLAVEVNNTKKLGYEYELLEWSEYEKIKESINSMDNVLVELREKYPNA